MPEERYTQLTGIEREEISKGIAQKKSIRQITREIRRSPCTVLIEIKRNSGKTWYCAFSANRQALKAGSSRNLGKRDLANNQRLRDYVI